MNLTLFAYEPIVEAMLTVGWSDEGWILTVNHRHHAGRFGACGRDDYDRLTLNELVDVLIALTFDWGPRSAPHHSRIDR